MGIANKAIHQLDSSMPHPNRTKKGILPSNLGECPLFGLEEFSKIIEKIFFADAEITQKHDQADGSTNLIINLNCNFGFPESLYHLNNGVWGGLSFDDHGDSSFEKTVQDFVSLNQNRVDIEELTINLKETSLIITKIHPNSITDHLGVILPAVGANFVHITKGLTEIPFEIFVPIFIEQTMTVGSTSTSYRMQHNTSKGYFDFWGLYFESNPDKDATIYDVRNKGIIQGDFFLLDF